jgi:hypothetical protein
LTAVESKMDVVLKGSNSKIVGVETADHPTGASLTPARQ